MQSVLPPYAGDRTIYPESDGKPMGETDQHRDLMTALIYALRWFLRGTYAYVAGNLFVYYQQGNPKAVVAPDVFVVLGVPQRRRRTYRAWMEGGRLPDVVIEVTAKQTRRADQVTKPVLYQQLGVREYILFDPYQEYLNPRLQGYRLAGERYVPIEGLPLRSEVLGLEFHDEGEELRLRNPATGQFLPMPDDVEQARIAAEDARIEAEEARLRAEEARRAAELRLIAERDARQVAEERLAALEAELARLRGDDAQRG